MITVASEVGVYGYQPEDVVAKGRLGPGQMLSVDTQTGQLYHTDDIDAQLKNARPYKAWLKAKALRFESTLELDEAENSLSDEQLKAYMKLYQVSFEERDQALRPMAEGGQEAVGSMGDDTLRAGRPGLHGQWYDYFLRRFGQITTPALNRRGKAIGMS